MDWLDRVLNPPRKTSNPAPVPNPNPEPPKPDTPTPVPEPEHPENIHEPDTPTPVPEPEHPENIHEPDTPTPVPEPEHPENIHEPDTPTPVPEPEHPEDIREPDTPMPEPEPEHPENIHEPDTPTPEPSPNYTPPVYREEKQPKNMPGMRAIERKASTPSYRHKRIRPPELICRRYRGDTHHEIELDIKEYKVTGVYQNGKILTREANRYKLSNYSGYLEIKYENGNPYGIPLFNDNKPLIFKLNKEWNGIGRRMKGITRGYFLVFVPSKWSWGETPLHDPELCSNGTFKAHFVYRDKDEDLPDFYEGGARYPLPIRDAIKLSGEPPLFDDSHCGPLHTGDVPNLKHPDGITWIRVGEERKGGWKGENFKPTEADLEEMLAGRQGRFYIRIYDKKVDLLDSIDFRYQQSLKKILLNGNLYTQDTVLLPDLLKGGYSSARLQFIDVDGRSIQPFLKKDNPYATVNFEGVVLVKPHPDADEVVCSLSTYRNQADITINLPRIWWRLKSDKKWRDIPWEFTKTEFLKKSKKDLTVKLRLPSNIERVKVGFDHKLDRTHPTRKGLKSDYTELELNMGAFKFNKQLRERLDTDISLNIQCLGREFTTRLITLVQVSPDPDPLPESKPRSNFKPKKLNVPPKFDPSKSPKVIFDPQSRDPLPPYVHERNNRQRSFNRHEVQNISLTDIHHLNLNLLRRCINERGKIHSAHRNGLPAKYQRAVRAAVIRARYLALLPYVPAHRKLTATLYDGGKSRTPGPEKR